LVCSENRPDININPKCYCPDGYFDDGTNSLCPRINLLIYKACLVQCTTCATYNNNCLACSGDKGEVYSRVWTPDCDCPFHYYSSGIPTCKSIYSSKVIVCDYVCGNCETNSDNCTTCSGNRVTTPSCPCKDEYFDVNVEMCPPCKARCATCITSKDNCLTCAGNHTKDQPICSCPNGFFENEQPACPGLSFIVNLACAVRCLTCVTSKTYCLTCEPSHTKIPAPTCLCEDGFYDNDINPPCQSNKLQIP
jgi:proprotein convertase subtilisin/kexin type 5